MINLLKNFCRLYIIQQLLTIITDLDNNLDIHFRRCRLFAVFFCKKICIGNQAIIINTVFAYLIL